MTKYQRFLQLLVNAGLAYSEAQRIAREATA